jgi:hypothetical protein
MISDLKVREQPALYFNMLVQSWGHDNKDIINSSVSLKL